MGSRLRNDRTHQGMRDPRLVAYGRAETGEKKLNFLSKLGSGLRLSDTAVESSTREFVNELEGSICFLSAPTYCGASLQG